MGASGGEQRGEHGMELRGDERSEISSKSIVVDVDKSEVGEVQSEWFIA